MSIKILKEVDTSGNNVVVEKDTSGNNVVVEKDTSGNNVVVEKDTSGNNVVVESDTKCCPEILLIDSKSRDPESNGEKTVFNNDPNGVCCKIMCCLACWTAMYFGITC
jgi:hypothetical protein